MTAAHLAALKAGDELLVRVTALSGRDDNCGTHIKVRTRERSGTVFHAPVADCAPSHADILAALCGEQGRLIAA